MKRALLTLVLIGISAIPLLWQTAQKIVGINKVVGK
jgi:hypothetical protein